MYHGFHLSKTGADDDDDGEEEQGLKKLKLYRIPAAADDDREH